MPKQQEQQHHQQQQEQQPPSSLISTPLTTSNLLTTSNKPERTTPLSISLLAGGFAGTTVDLALYPIDTVKTRLQSPRGFLASGGFRGIYNGVGAAALGSAPGAALFFGVYERLKAVLSEECLSDAKGGTVLHNRVLVHMTAASLGEAAACLVRVPTEVLKQNMQTNISSTSPTASTASNTNTFRATLRTVLSQKGTSPFVPSIFGGLYRGYAVTLLREVPFALIQFPLYEHMKTLWAEYNYNQHHHGTIREATPLQAAACGSISGGIAGALTTPLDVVKTRLMIGVDSKGVRYRNAVDVAVRVWREEGWRRFWSGVGPRVVWISIGGFVYFGAYENSREVFMPLLGY